jgi:hypothetical protein
MTLTVENVYSVRFGAKLPLPQMVQSNIAKLRIVPVVYKPIRPVHVKNNGFRNNKPAVVENWREKALVEVIRRVKEREDPEYSEIFSILNKLTSSNMEKLSNDAIVYIQKRDNEFRLRVTMLLFDKAITQNAYAAVMSEFAKRLSNVFPDIPDDLSSQIEMFPKLYNMTETAVFPASDDPLFDSKVIEWSTQKNKRRGYAKFIIYLYNHGLIAETIVEKSILLVLKDLDDIVRSVKSPQVEENVTQFVEFLAETAKLIPKTSLSLRTILKNGIDTILKSPKEELKNLNMRSKFKLEDTVKCVQ